MEWYLPVIWAAVLGTFIVPNYLSAVAWILLAGPNPLGKVGALTAQSKEFEVLAYLARHPGQTVTRDMLGRDVWQEPGHALTNVIDAYISLLRRKVERPGEPARIHTVRGVGYRLGEGPCA